MWANYHQFTTFSSTGKLVCTILKLFPLLFNTLHFGLSSSVEDRVSFMGDRGAGQES